MTISSPPSNPTSPLLGVHHVTALAGDPARNAEFYTRVLGHRLVKRTVNFDDPTTYHLYYGDESGSPGTLLTHFPHPRARPCVHGTSEIRQTVMTVPQGSLGYWIERLKAHNVRFRAETTLDADRVSFEDPDGMGLSLVEGACPAGRRGYAGAGVEARHAITGVEGVVIHVPNVAETADFLQKALGFTDVICCGERHWLHLGQGRAGERIELVEDPDGAALRMGAGTVHHVAWRVPDDATQARVAEAIRGAGHGVTPVRDRQYFRSIYFRIPGGVIFEIATDGPGFDIDEPRGALGSSLKLPPQYEGRRSEIERHLVPLGGEA